MRKETVRNANVLHVDYYDVKKRKCRTKQTINGKRFLREQYLSIKIYRNFGDWRNDKECQMFVCEKFDEWGVVFSEMELHFYSNKNQRITEWNDWTTVVECFCGFSSPIAMEKNAALITDTFESELFLRRNKDYRIFPGQFREKPTHFTAKDIRMCLLIFTEGK